MKRNQIKSGIILSYISKIIQVVVGILYTPIMIRLLGQSEYGLYNIAASIVAYLGLLNLGFGSAYMRFYSRYKVEDENEVANLNGMFVEIFVVLGIVAVFAGVILANNLNILFGASLTGSEITTARILMMILVINLALSFPAIVFSLFIQANEQFVIQNLLLIIYQIATPLVSLPLLIWGLGSIGMVLGSTIVSVLINIVTIYYAINKLGMKISFNKFDVNLFKEMSTFSFFIFINMVVDQINNNVDKTILGRYQGTTAVAIYSVGASLNTYYIQISTAVSSVFTPRVHRIISKGEDNHSITNLFTMVGRIQFMLLSMVCLGFIFFGKAFIELWVGIGYSDSYYVAAILMTTITVPLIQNLGVEIQRAKNKHKFRSWLYIGMAIGNIMLSIALSQMYGAIGATIGTALSYIIGNGFIMNWYNQQKVGLDIKFFWKQITKIFPTFIIPIIYGLIVNLTVNLSSLVNMAIFGLIFVIIFVVSLWFFGLNKEEKKLVLPSLVK